MAILGGLGAVLEWSWSGLGRSWGGLGWSWGDLRVFLGGLKLLLAGLEATLEGSWAILRLCWAGWGAKHADFPAVVQCFCNIEVSNTNCHLGWS